MRKVLIAAIASALVTGAVIVTTGVAQNDNERSSPPQTMRQALQQRDQDRDARLARIARRLGVSADRLKEAMESVRDDNLDEAVREGRLTDAQRDAIKACMDEPLTCDRSNLPAFRHGPRGDGPRPRGGLRREMRGKLREFAADLARELDVSQQRVIQAFQAERPREPRFRERGGPGPGHGRGGPGGPDGPAGIGVPLGPPPGAPA